LALIEVGIDFPEYDDIEKASEEKIVSICQKNIKAIDELIKNGREGRMIKEGVKVAIVGKPNVGKSSILNALLEKDKAIVSDIAGTTRDIVEGEINIKGVPFLLFDTAGIHESNDFIEKIGVDKSIKSIEEADLVVLVKDSREPTLDEEEKTILKKAGDKAFVCLNKSDLNEANIPGYISISALNKDVDALKDKLIDSLSLSEGIFDTPSLSNARQLSLLKTIKDDLIKAKEDASNHEPMDFISVSIQSAYHKINELFGKECNNDISDEIFSRFCVGK
jgi:tRNA modification GTPase